MGLDIGFGFVLVLKPYWYEEYKCDRDEGLCWACHKITPGKTVTGGRRGTFS